MLIKLSRIGLTSNVGIHKTMIFSIFSKKRFSTLKYYGVIKGSVKLTKRRRG
jgi:hypothetical protein